MLSRVLGNVKHSLLGFNLTTARFRSTKIGLELSKFDRLKMASERELFDTIVKNCLEPRIHNHFFSTNLKVKTIELIKLVAAAEEFCHFPVFPIIHSNDKINRQVFEERQAFVNLPFSQTTNQWSDREILKRILDNQSLFVKLFNEQDTVIVPGCADGQIAIQISENALRYDIKLDVIGADLNSTAMKLGYLAMKSFGLDTDRVQWVNADISSQEFFDWVRLKFTSQSVLKCPRQNFV